MPASPSHLSIMWTEIKKASPIHRDPGPVVAMLRLEGVIARGAGRGGRGLSLAGVETALDKAFGLSRAAAVALVINSPGGAPVQSRMIHDRIRALAEEKNREVLVFCEDVAASGGYMIACAGDEIYADTSSIVGSIGVIGAGFGAHEALAKLGLERRVYTAGENKLRLDPFQPEKPDDVAFVERIQSNIHEDFIALVKARRGRRLSTSAALFEGDVWTGREAVDLGVIDGLGHARDVLRERFGSRVQVKKIAAAKPPWTQRLLGGMSSSLVESAADAIERRALWARYLQ